MTTFTLEEWGGGDLLFNHSAQFEIVPREQVLYTEWYSIGGMSEC